MVLHCGLRCTFNFWHPARMTWTSGHQLRHPMMWLPWNWLGLPQVYIYPPVIKHDDGKSWNIQGFNYGGTTMWRGYKMIFLYGPKLIDGFPYNLIRDWQFHWHIYKEARIFCVSRDPSLSDRWSCCIHNTGRSSSVAVGAHFAFVDTRSADIPICLIYII
jgi:hypothetical protein